MLVSQVEKIVVSFNALDETCPESLKPFQKKLHNITRWVHDYLCKPHPELGRSGPVCPFVPTAIEKGLLQVIVYPGVTMETDRQTIHQIMLDERDAFLNTQPMRGNNAQFKAFLLIFPNLPDPQSHQIIDSIQSHLQEDFVEKGLMVGEFHPGPPDKVGLWNTSFRPLDCPEPMLAIRHMVPTDILFLKDQDNLVAEYLRIFGDLVPSRFRHLVEEAAARFGFDLPETNPKTSSAPTVIYHLEKNKIPYKVHRHAEHDTPIIRPEDFALALQYDVARISKALVVRDTSSEVFAILVCGATRKANLKRVASELGVKRLELATLADLKNKVGLPPLAVTPIGLRELPTFIDADLFRFETILTGAGVPKMELELSPEDLAELSMAKKLAFTR